MASLTLGCANRQVAVVGTVKSLVWPDNAVNHATLNPQLRYLRVTVEGKALLMVLGYVDQDLHGRPVEVWYSADGEVLRLQSRRIVGLTGAPVEWANVQLPSTLPRWRDLKTGYQYVRRFNEMPNYRWGRLDSITVQESQRPRGAAPIGWRESELRWLEEHVEGKPSWSVARYALKQGLDDPVYGEQCLGESLCLSWQVWPPPH